MAAKDGKSIAFIYAEALYDVAAEMKIVPEIEQQLLTLSEAVKHDVRLRRFLETPTIALPEKRKVLAGALAKLHQILQNFICLMIDHERVGALDAMVEAFHDHANKKAGIAEFAVVSAEPMLPAEEEQLKTALHQKLNRQIVLKTSTNPGLLGGLVLTHQDKMWDASIAHRLGRIVNKMEVVKGGLGFWKD